MKSEQFFQNDRQFAYRNLKTAIQFKLYGTYRFDLVVTPIFSYPSNPLKQCIIASD